MIAGLADHDNYHAFCHLLGRFKVNYQVNQPSFRFCTNLLLYYLCERLKMKYYVDRTSFMYLYKPFLLLRVNHLFIYLFHSTFYLKDPYFIKQVVPVQNWKNGLSFSFSIIKSNDFMAVGSI